MNIGFETDRVAAKTRSPARDRFCPSRSSGVKSLGYPFARFLHRNTFMLSVEHTSFIDLQCAMLKLESPQPNLHINDAIAVKFGLWSEQEGKQQNNGLVPKVQRACVFPSTRHEHARAWCVRSVAACFIIISTGEGSTQDSQNHFPPHAPTFPRLRCAPPTLCPTFLSYVVHPVFFAVVTRSSSLAFLFHL